MTTLVLRFAAGRYRMLPWTPPGGEESPPSPWRLLRSLHSTWRTRLPAVPEAVVHGLLDALAEPPVWLVPPCRGVGGQVTLDDDVELAAHWPGQLRRDHHDTLCELAAAMPYLGRADNRCAGRVDQSWSESPHHQRWDPVDHIEARRGMSVLAPVLPLNPASFLARPLHALPGVDVLPDGARLVAYVQQLPKLATTLPTAVRFTVLGSRPAATATVAVTDLLRRAALAHLGTLRTSEGRTHLGGRDTDASVLRDQHAHTSYLPVLDGAEIAAVVAWTPGGLPADEVAALRSVVRLSTNRQDHPVHIAPSPSGPVQHLAPTIIGPATMWISTTPYTPSRYPKKRDWPTFLLDDLTRELGFRNLPVPDSVEIVDREWRTWRRSRPSASRTSGQGRVTRDSVFLRVSFPQPVHGPLALGHLSHFGLGLFQPVVDGVIECERFDAP